MNDRISKWTWDKFQSKPPVKPLSEPIQDPDALKALVSFPDADAVEAVFFPQLGCAYLVVTGCEIDETDRNLGTNFEWAVFVITASEFADMNQRAVEKFRAAKELPESLIQVLVANGIFEFDDFCLVAHDWLTAQDGITELMAEDIFDLADKRSENSAYLAAYRQRKQSDEQDKT